MTQRPDAVNQAIAVARQYALLGDRDQAFAWLEKAYARRDSEMPHVHLHGELDTLRDDPRFADLARRIGLPPSALEASRALAARVPFPTLDKLERAVE
jgi:hypothetical protein